MSLWLISFKWTHVYIRHFYLAPFRHNCFVIFLFSICPMSIRENSWFYRPYSQKLSSTHFLVARRVDLVIAFAFLTQNFVKVVRTYERYFVILWMHFEWWERLRGDGGNKTSFLCPSCVCTPPPCPHTACTLRSHLVKLSLLIFGLALPDSKYFSSDNQ